MSLPVAERLAEYVAYLRDMGIADLYARPAASSRLDDAVLRQLLESAARVQPPIARPAPANIAASVPVVRTERAPQPARTAAPPAPPQRAPQPIAPPPLPPELSAPMPRPTPLNDLIPLPTAAIEPAAKAAALEAIHADLGDCTRCPLAYAGRHTIVFCDGDPNADLMFVGEGPGADEDATGIPFVGKAGQLLNNMIAAMGVAREAVFIANIVKCRPPGNRAPEYVEANTCAPFLARQIDVVQPKVIVALGKTAANYLRGNTDSLTSQRGRWFETRGSKLLVTYHPAFLLRDPRQKVEAWKDLQLVMKELGLSPPKKA